MLGGYPLWLVRTINFSSNFKNQLGIGSVFSKLEMELESYFFFFEQLDLELLFIFQICEVGWLITNCEGL